MDDNPYRSPLADGAAVVGVLSGRREDVRSVAVYQKGILVCILFQILAYVAQVLVPPELRLLTGLAIFGTSITGTVFVFLLAIKVYGAGLGVVLGLLALIPCVGLIVLLIVNGKATNILQRNGCHVGLMGANLSQIQ